MLNLVFEVGPNGTLPTRGSPEAAGLDLYAAHDIEIPYWSSAKVQLDIQSRFDAGWVGLIWDRSGMGSKRIHRYAGVIDSDYRGEWAVILFNSNYGSFHVQKGDRVAQVIFQPVWIGEPVEGNILDPTERGAGGFGSTGT